MKKILTFAVLAVTLMFAGARLSAQGKYGADSANCIKYLSYYQDYYKQKAYDDATPNWRKAYSACPATASQNLFINGAALIRRQISKNAANAEYKQQLIDTLMTLHETRAKFYPSKAAQALNNKGVDMSNYIKNDPQKLFDGYNDIISRNQTATKPSIFLFDMQAAIDLFNDGKIDAEKVIDTYENNIALLDEVKPANDEDAEQVESVRSDLESLFITSKVASCEDLIKLFTPRYNAAPNDLQLAKNIVKMLSITEDCQNNDLFLNAVTTMNKQDPSYTSSYYLYKLHASRGNTDTAIKYLEEAIAYPESDRKTDATYSYELAAFCYKNGRLGKAYSAARSAAELDPSLQGKSYFLIGQIWGGVACGGDEISARAHFWVAVDYLQKAKAADASLTTEANRMIGQFSRYYPQTAEAFMYNITDGQAYTVVCNGMSATTTVRTQK